MEKGDGQKGGCGISSLTDCNLTDTQPPSVDSRGVGPELVTWHATKNRQMRSYCHAKIRGRWNKTKAKPY